MKLEQVKYKQCPRCAEFGHKMKYPTADAIKKTTTSGENVYTGEYKSHKRKYCNPCGRDIAAKLDTHWKDM